MRVSCSDHESIEGRVTTIVKGYIAIGDKNMISSESTLAGRIQIAL